MEALNAIFAHSHNYNIYTCECCISVCSYDSPSVHVCHTFVSMTYLPKAGISESFEQPTLCFDKDELTSKIEYFDP